MKNVGVLLFCFALFGSCQNAPIEKPDNLIDQDKMVDIMFDINVLVLINDYFFCCNCIFRVQL